MYHLRCRLISVNTPLSRGHSAARDMPRQSVLIELLPQELPSIMGAPAEVVKTMGLARLLFPGILSLMISTNVIAHGTSKTRHITLGEAAIVETKEGFIKVGEITTDSKNNIYVADDYAFSVKRFDPEGAFQHEFGRRGKKDGEFSSFLFRMICARDTLALCELGNSRVLLFTTDGMFVRTFSVPGPIVDIAFDDKRRVYTSLMPVSKNNGDYVLLYDSFGNMVSRVFLHHVSGERSFNMVQLAVDSKNNLIVAYHFLNRIEVFRDGREQLAEFTVRGLPEKSPAAKSKYEELGSIPQGEIIKDIAVDPKDNIFVLAGEYSSHPSRDVVVLDSLGRQLAALVLPSRTGFIYIGHDGFLYTREQERTVVKKYRMVYHGF